jgi:ribosomal protein S18 acetylase RimI-like enzyme
MTGPPKPEITQVRRAGMDDIPRMAVSLARAFADDPVQIWILPQARRHTRLTAMFGLMLGFQVPLAETYITPDGVGAAVWAPPGRWRLDLDAMAPSVKRFVAVFGPNIGKATDVLSAVEGNHPTEPPHWFLAMLGTHPDWQGLGIGTALLQPILTRADAERTPAYLESSKERNIAYYRRFGFEVTGEIRLPKGGPTLWQMWREPQPNGGEVRLPKEA